MPAQTRTFYSPPGDLSLGSVNEFLRTVDTEQLNSFLVSPSGRGAMITFSVSKGPPVKLLASSPEEDAWVLPSYIPEEMRFLFSGPIDPSSIGESTFFWVYGGANDTVDPSTVSLLEEGYEVRVPVPVNSSFEGPIALVAQGLKDESGDLVPTARVGFHVTNGRIPKPKGEGSSTVSGLRMARLVASGVNPGRLFTDFCIRNSIELSSIVQTEQISREPGIIETFVLWKTGSGYPVLVATDPPLGSTVPEASAVDDLILHFSEPVSAYHAKGLDGTTRIEIDDEPITGSLIEQVDAVGSVWRINSLAGIMDQRGVHTLLVRGLPGIDGLHSRLIRLYSWTVAPVGAAAGAENTPRCQTFAGDGVTTGFTLSFTPITCSLHVYVGGVFQHADCYTQAGTALTFVTAPYSGAVIEVRYLSS